jgi:hypothetical protein
MSKLHMVDPHELVRSVILQEPVEAICGFSKVFTREAIDKAAGSQRKQCPACLTAVGNLARTTQTIIQAPHGWLALLERVHAATYAPRTVHTYVYEWPTPGSSHKSFPTAA